uniref:Uncharacterized protein n=1 Tax=Arundo donax TaxID=35708 RepID=A0A0A9GQB3_ARUDO
MKHWNPIQSWRGRV